MRALEPRLRGSATNPHDGVRLSYEVFGPAEAPRTVVLVPAGLFAHARMWKLQVPFLAMRGYRVVTYDCRGSGGSERPETGYTPDLFAADLLAVLAEVGVTKAAFVGMTWALRWLGPIAADHPELVTHLVSIGTFPSAHQARPLTPAEQAWVVEVFMAEVTPSTPVDWRGVDMRDRYPEMASAIATEDFCEPHSTKAIEDLTAWALETEPRHLIASCLELTSGDRGDYFEKVRCPTLIVHGELDPAIPLTTALRVHEAMPGSELTVVRGGGHIPVVRDPVRSNLMIDEFINRGQGAQPGRREWTRARSRHTKRALFVSSPIGLGHAQRDVAIAKELRELVPGLEIDWLAQHPVTRVLEANGERIHPASALLAGESPHIESLMGAQHELNVFQAIREMDEILLANFHVFHEVARDGNYDLWVGDEAWEVDYYLHENPELKSAPFAWLTDFVGYLPMLDGDEREAYVVADYNAEMIEQVARFKRVRDAAIYIGEQSDIVPDAFGPELPLIGEWVPRHFELGGYVRYFDPADLGDRAERRKRFGFEEGERVAVAAVGGTSVGASLLRRIVESFPAAKEALPDLRLVVVCGPRIDPASLPRVDGVSYLGYVHNLYEMLAVADVAMVQGGLSTTMELVASGTPFLYFPLTNHFEQNRHVAHRLERYGVPSHARVKFAETGGDWLADKLTRLLSAPPRYLEVAGGGARRAAERLAALL
ncbi:MAG: alpha/beta fold hydrolase [Trueperaceae bacterium]|nr:alpha/beta fold hydrolase [Trueperaceae bacterium]